MASLLYLGLSYYSDDSGRGDGACTTLGIVLSWLLVHKINVISFGWTMPLIVGAEPIVFLLLLLLLSYQPHLFGINEAAGGDQ
ncbi:MAG: hypothetical protein CM15mP84_10480 [Cellvibrionales bacterium]|nr:MAG: hypothetical protein CM15mP84_10480 [Cellvibrionales bacterium]